VTEILRKIGVVGKFVEFFGPGLPSLPLADRATIANMAPEYGATCGIFPVDETTLSFLRTTGRDAQQVALVEAYCKTQGLFHTAQTEDAEYSQVVELDLSTVEPSVAGPRRPQDRAPLSKAKESFEAALPTLIGPRPSQPARKVAPQQVERFEGEGGTPIGIAEDPTLPAGTKELGEDVFEYLHDGAVVIAAITSCTNTSNPSVMMAAGLLAKKAVEKGLKRKPWVKTSLAPGSRVVTEYYRNAGLIPYMDQLGFHTVGYGCTTCIGNSGPLPQDVSHAITEKQLVVASVLSGNRNFEGRINSEVRANYLMSPPLVVAYALAGRIDLDITQDSLGKGKDGKPVYLRDIWPTQKEVQDTVSAAINSSMFTKNYATIFDGDEEWKHLPVPEGETYVWEADSTYIKRAPYFDNMPAQPAAVKEIKGARVLAKLGHSVTTDHISPAGSIKASSPAGKYLQEHGVKPNDFNSYGSRRGNHEVMVRGTFANVRLRNQLAPGSEGGVTRHFPDGETMSIFDASVKYIADGIPTIVLAGKEYGSGSSRDWAAKGPLLLGIRAVIAESYERIHRSNLVGMGILPLQFLAEENAETLGLQGDEVYEIIGLPALLANKFANGKQVHVRATGADGAANEFSALVRIDTPQEILYYEHGGILQYVLRQLLATKTQPETVTV
jgi:aconitate hydratase